MNGTDFDLDIAEVHRAGAEQTGATVRDELVKDETETAEVVAKANMLRVCVEEGSVMVEKR
jgi:hypothetical protein